VFVEVNRFFDFEGGNMSARTESVNITAKDENVEKEEKRTEGVKRQRIPTAVKIVSVALVPVIVLFVSLFLYGMYIQNAAQIYANITIGGVNVSGLTQEEALQALGVTEHDERINNTRIGLILPDETEIIISGHDVDMQHNIREKVEAAYSIGRGEGVFLDAISYMQSYSAEEMVFNVEFSLNEDLLNSIVTEVAEVYNADLEASVPVILEDRIDFTKGAGQVNANDQRMFELTYVGLFDSLESGNVVEITYELQGDIVFVLEVMELRNEIFVAAASSELDLETLEATECVIGVDFDTHEFATLVGEAELGETVTVYFDFTYPEITQEYMESLLFRDLIGRRTTQAGGTAGRLNNINIANQAINGTILLPGDEFSFNQIVGPRTSARGFQSAPVISNGQFVPGIGGGICQTSSTLFAAIRPSELRVTERRPHSRPISYLPPGWDAAVAWGHIDFRFVNNTDFPLKIYMSLEGRTVTAEVWGTIRDDFPREADWNS